jgi:hypothetical protein
MERILPAQLDSCGCRSKPNWIVIDDDSVMRWQAIDIGEWEEIRICPICANTWLAAWPAEGESPPILCRIFPKSCRKLKELDRAKTFRSYFLSKLEEHFGLLQEQKADCRKVRCTRKRIAGTGYCLEHLIAERFGRSFAHLGNPEETIDE